MSRSASHRPAFTLVELAVVVAIAGLATLTGIRGLARQLDRMAARSAISTASLLIARARDEALVRHAIVAVRIDTAQGRIALAARGQRFADAALGHEHGVRLSTTRDSIAFDVRGLGYGAANLTLVARRGAAAETLVVSRLGRTRY